MSFSSDFVSFRIIDDPSDSQNEVNSLNENNDDDFNFDFNQNCPWPDYSTETPYSHHVVIRPNMAKDKLKLEARFIALKITSNVR